MRFCRQSHLFANCSCLQLCADATRLQALRVDSDVERDSHAQLKNVTALNGGPQSQLCCWFNTVHTTPRLLRTYRADCGCAVANTTILPHGIATSGC